MAEIVLTPEEQYKVQVITQVINKEIKPGYAAKLLDLSVRQIRRLKITLKQAGKQAIVHGLKGKESNHHIDPLVKEKAIQLVREKYADFKPAFASEKLQENHNLKITAQTIRVWMTEEKLWRPRKQKQAIYRAWRPRKEYYGELEQFDGSYHYWLENRYCDEDGNPLEMCLLAAIDDATGNITQAVFAQSEGVIPVFTFWKNYVEQLGKPMYLYLDKFSTYKINHKSAVDNFELMTQFQRVMKALSITIITAHSPQAKGRIERLFQTLQDRLVKELRLANITTPNAANTFLQEIFIPHYNNKFPVVAAKQGNIHKPLTKQETKNIHHIFSMQETRIVHNDFTIQFKNTWYQLTEIQPTTIRAKEHVLIETWLDKSIHITCKGYDLSSMLLPEKPQKIQKQPIILTTHTLNYK